LLYKKVVLLGCVLRTKGRRKKKEQESLRKIRPEKKIKEEVPITYRKESGSCFDGPSRGEGKGQSLESGFAPQETMTESKNNGSEDQTSQKTGEEQEQTVENS